MPVTPAFDPAFYEAAAAVIPVFVLAAVVQESRDPRPTELSGFWWVFVTLVVGGLGEIAAFATIAANGEHRWWRAAVIAGLLNSGLFVSVRILLPLASDALLGRSAVRLALVAAVGGAIYFIYRTFT